MTIASWVWGSDLLGSCRKLGSMVRKWVLSYNPNIFHKKNRWNNSFFLVIYELPTGNWIVAGVPNDPAGWSTELRGAKPKIPPPQVEVKVEPLEEIKEEVGQEGERSVNLNKGTRCRTYGDYFSDFMLSNMLIFSFDLSIQQLCFHPWKSADSTNPPVTSFSDRRQKNWKKSHLRFKWLSLLLANS